MHLLHIGGRNSDALGPKWMSDRMSRGGKNEPIYIAFKYECPPTMTEEFIDEWMRFEDELRREEKCDYYMFSKTSTDNIYFWSYLEWDSWRDMMEHMDSKYVEKFADFCSENDILVEMFPLEAIGDTGMKTRGRGRRNMEDLSKRGGRREHAEEEDPRDLPAHVHIQFHVPPSMCDKFEDEWLEVAERTYDEKENLHYALRKFATLNHHYMASGSWDTLNGYMDHVTSKHFRKLREFTADYDIEWHAQPMCALACSEKEEV